MSIYRNKYGIYQISFRTPSGERFRRTTGTTDRQLAQELHDKLKHDMWRQEHLDEKPKHLWDEACIRWIQENQGKKSLSADKIKIRLLPELRGLLLEDMTRDLIHNVVNRKTCSGSTKKQILRPDTRHPEQMRERMGLARQSPQAQTPQRAEETYQVVVSRRSTTAGQCLGAPTLYAASGYLLARYRIETGQRA